MTLVKVAIKQAGDMALSFSLCHEPHPLILQQRGALYEGTVEQEQRICHHVMRLQAGEVAQKVFCAESLEPYRPAADRVQIQSWIAGWNRYARPGEREAQIESLYLNTQQLLTAPLCAAAVDAVAEALLEHKELAGIRAHQIISEAMHTVRAAATASGERPPNLNCPHCEEYGEWTDDLVSVQLFP